MKLKCFYYQFSPLLEYFFRLKERTRTLMDFHLIITLKRINRLEKKSLRRQQMPNRVYWPGSTEFAWSNSIGFFMKYLLLLAPGMNFFRVSFQVSATVLLSSTTDIFTIIRNPPPTNRPSMAPIWFRLSSSCFAPFLFCFVFIGEVASFLFPSFLFFVVVCRSLCIAPVYRLMASFLLPRMRPVQAIGTSASPTHWRL